MRELACEIACENYSCWKVQVKRAGESWKLAECSFMTMRVDEVYIYRLAPEKSSKYFSISIILLLTPLVWKSIKNLKLLQIYHD